MSEFVKVGKLLGVPTPVDPHRPQEDGSATSYSTAPDYPVYRVRKVCHTREIAEGITLRGCGQSYVGSSFSPQYDDDPAMEYPCDDCISRYEIERVARFKDMRAKDHPKRHYRESAPVRGVRDPLETR